MTQRLSIVHAACLLLLCACQMADFVPRVPLLTEARTEEWTIFCHEFNGPQHAAHCQAVAETLARTPGIRAGEVRCDDDAGNQTSWLYYGAYQRQVDPKTLDRSPSPQAAQDLVLIKDLGDGRGGRLFWHASLAPATDANVSRPEFALARAKGLYSLQVAVFIPEFGFKDVKRAAIDYVASLRQEGHEAYYHHGISSSTVTVGSFGADAVIEKGTGERKYSSEVEALRRKAAFKYNYENGQIRTKVVSDPQKPRKKARIEPLSFLVKIPRTGQGPALW